MLLRNPCKNLKSYDNPFWGKSNGGNNKMRSAVILARSAVILARSAVIWTRSAVICRKSAVICRKSAVICLNRK